MVKKKKVVYDDKFYRMRDEETTPSAMKILTVVRENFEINSAVDFGCGVGTWLKCLKEVAGSNCDVLGLDGEYVPREYMVIKGEEFKPTDLNKRVELKRRYDLAISLEVGEHLSKERSNSFVEDICKASDIVLFSAATKYQGGDAHINEQRLSFWVSLFSEQNYEMIDIIRPAIWDDDEIPVWYRENAVIFYNSANSSICECAKEAINKCNSRLVDIIHPDLFESRSRMALHPVVKTLYSIRSFFGNIFR